ncbi:MAG: tetratricopeptide repeat protein [Bacteroidetes bacterium]|nr:tetratricopeptide repeat protein [Bacteroidota bacterium]
MRILLPVICFSFVATLLQAQTFWEKGGFALEAQRFYEQATALHDAGELESAAEYYGAAIETDPQHFKALYNLALVYFDLGKYGKAEVTLGKLLGANPADTAAYELYGHVLSRNGQHERAIECFNIALNSAPTDDLYVNRALAYISTGRGTMALHDFDEALKLNPENFEACLGKGITLSELGQNRLAISWFDHAISIRPDDASAYANRAVAQFQIGEKEAAMTDFRTAIWKNRQPDTYLLRARCYLLDGNLSDALADAKEALILDSENPEVYALVGEIELKKGDLAAAIESFGVAIDLRPDHSAYYLRRSEAKIKNRQCYEAVSDLYRVLDLEPYNPEARKMLQTAYSQIDAEVQNQVLSASGRL